jgi:predicted phosphoribosyltransferase
MFDSIIRKFQFRFKDRVTAANILAAALQDSLDKKKKEGQTNNNNNNNIVVLGIPRGGVITADVVATKLGTSVDFDIVIPRKLGMPHNEESAIGAIMEDGTTYLDDTLVKELEVSQEYLEQEKARQIEEIRRRSALYRKTQRDYTSLLKDRIVILVDDGAASGATVLAAARSIRRRYTPEHLIIALPVAPKETVNLLKMEADYVEVVTSPSASFNSVGQYYKDFKPVTDEQVIKIMHNRNLL